MRKTKRNWTAAGLVFAAALSTTPVFAAKEKEGSTSNANTESTSKEASTENDGERTIIDHAGNEVTLPEEINRIVVTDTLPLPSVLSLYLDSILFLFLVSCIRKFLMQILHFLKIMSLILRAY